MSSYRMYLHGHSSINGEKSFTVLAREVSSSPFFGPPLALAWPCSRLGNLCPHTVCICMDRTASMGRVASLFSAREVSSPSFGPPLALAWPNTRLRILCPHTGCICMDNGQQHQWRKELHCFRQEKSALPHLVHAWHSHGQYLSEKSVSSYSMYLHG